MLRRVIRLALSHPGLVLVLAVVLLGWGGLSAAKAPLDVFPEFVQPQATIQTEAPGLSAEQVEELVTRAVEQAVNGAAGLESVRSESLPGLSVVTALFRDDAEVRAARQGLAERLAGLKLPEAARTPALEPLTSSTMDLLKIGLVSDRLSGRALRGWADWTLRPRLLAVPGVARVNVFGGEVEQLQVQVLPERLIALGLSLAEVTDAARAASAVRGAGFIETPAQRIFIQAEERMFTPEQLGEVVVRAGSPPVCLRDVARVELGGEPRFGDALIMGRPGVLLTLSSQAGANTLAVTRALEETLAGLKPELARSGILLYPRLHRPATFIETALAHMQGSLLAGGALVGLVLLLFLLDLRTAFISFVSIPLSLLSAVLVLEAWGVSLNTMTLAGFAVALGIVVDDAIIDVDNIVRRLRENAAASPPRPRARVILDASLEVNSAVVYATFIVVAVFLPVLTMSGLQGKFFAPLAVAVILSILASLAVALTVTPALCLLLLRSATLHREPAWIGWLKELHAGWLLFFARRPRVTAAGALVLVAGACCLLPLFGGELMPEFREGHFVIGMKARAGSSLDESLRLGRLLCRRMLADPRIATVEQQVGRAEAGEDTWGPHQSEFHVELRPGISAADETDVQASLRRMMTALPGVQSEVLTFLGDRIAETVSGETASVVVGIFGDDLDLLGATGRQVAEELEAIRGHADVQVKSAPLAPMVSIRLRPERLAQFGFRPKEVLESIETAYAGSTVAQVGEGSRWREISVILATEARRDPAQVGGLLVSSAGGAQMPLGELAEVRLRDARTSIEHEGTRRRLAVTCNVEHRDVASFAAEARARVQAAVKLPAGLSLEWKGAAEEQRKAHAELLLHCLAALVGVVLLLSLVFPRPRHVALVLTNLPFALVGGVLAVFSTGGSASIGSWVGFVTLFGISTRNSIMLLAHYRHLVEQEGAPWSLATLARGAGERLQPILMTALVTALGVLPLAWGRAEAGREIEGPMAVVILGGLVTSTVLNLVVLPAFVWRWGALAQGSDPAGPPRSLFRFSR